MITDVAITGLAKAMDSLKGSIESAFDFAQRAEKSSMALGMSFGQASDQLGGTMKGLRGDLNERFAGAIAGLEAGLQGNTAGIGRLINQQRLTGTASAKTAEAFAKMEMTMGLSRETTNRLASNMVELGAEFQISTDNLVGAINMMAESFPAQKLAGMGAEVNDAVTSLQAELGSSMSGPLNSVMKMIMDTSMEGYENLTKLGIGNVREQLSAAKDSAEANRILKDAIAIASRNFKDVVGDASEGFFQVGVASEIFSKSALDIVTVQDAFGQRVKVEGDQAAEFGNQLAVLKSEILMPLQEAFLEFFPVIKEVSMILMGFAKDVIGALVDKGKEFFKTLDPLGGSMEGFRIAMEDAVPKVVDGIMKVVGIFQHIEVVAGVLIAMALIPLKTIIVGLITTLGAIIGTIVTTLTTIFSPVILVVGAVVGILVILQKKFGILDPLIGAVSNAFITTKNAIGKMLVGLAEKLDFIPGAGKLKEFGESLQTVVDENEKAVVSIRRATREEAIAFNKKKIEDSYAERARIEKTRRETGNEKFKDIRHDFLEKDTRLRQKLLEKLENQTDAEYEAEQRKKEQDNKHEEQLNGINEATKDTAKQTQEINAKTFGEVNTQAQFLDETANMLGRSIEAILGIGVDDTQSKILETLEIGNEQRAAQQNQGSEGGVIPTT